MERKLRKQKGALINPSPGALALHGRGRDRAGAESGIESSNGRNLRGKTAVVTGSTSGIGLGIAQALAARGVDLMLNGLGDAAEVERLRAGMAAAHGLRVAYSGADLSKGGRSFRRGGSRLYGVLAKR